MRNDILYGIGMLLAASGIRRPGARWPGLCLRNHHGQYVFALSRLGKY